MKNPALIAALSNVSLEDLGGTDAMISEFASVPAPITPSAVFHEGIEVDADVTILEATADAIVSKGDENTEVSLESAIVLVNAITHRYGGQIDITSMESGGKLDAAAVVADIRRITASLENAQVASMESYAMSDLWDKIGMMEREIPELEDNIKQLEKLAGAKVETRHGWNALLTGVLQAFTVDGSWTSPSKAVSSTGAVLDSMTKLGSEAIDHAKKATEMAKKVNFDNESEAEAFVKTLSGIKGPADALLEIGRSKKIMGNRTLKMTVKNVKVPATYGSWNSTVDVDVSWQKASVGLIFDILFTGGIIYFGVGATKKQQVKIDDLVTGLKGVVAAAKKVHALRSESARKWSAHKELVETLKNGVDSPLVVRAITEMDRMGWSAINTAFTVVSHILRECNAAAGKIVKTEA
jgi:hypothetical protein